MDFPIPEEAPVIKIMGRGFIFICVNKETKKRASYLHRTATTTYPCCVPTLGDSAGAGRIGLAHANIIKPQSFPNFLGIILTSNLY